MDDAGWPFHALCMHAYNAVMSLAPGLTLETLVGVTVSSHVLPCALCFCVPLGFGDTNTPSVMFETHDEIGTLVYFRSS